MIYQEIIEINGKSYTHTYSDMYYIRQLETGALYADAVDICPCQYTYEETDEPLQEQSAEEMKE